MFKRCKHDWKILVDTMLELDKDTIQLFVTAPTKILRKTHICIVTCKKCGKIKKFVTQSFG